MKFPTALLLSLLLGLKAVESYKSSATSYTTKLSFSNLQSVTCHGMVIDGPYAYITGLTAASVFG